MAGKEKEVVDVVPSILATAVWLEHIGILQLVGIELLHGNHFVILQEEPPIGLAPEEFEYRARRLGAMSIFSFNQKYRLAALQQFDGAIEDIQFVAFDVDLHERHILI